MSGFKVIGIGVAFAVLLLLAGPSPTARADASASRTGRHSSASVNGTRNANANGDTTGFSVTGTCTPKPGCPLFSVFVVVTITCDGKKIEFSTDDDETELEVSMQELADEWKNAHDEDAPFSVPKDKKPKKHDKDSDKKAKGATDVMNTCTVEYGVRCNCQLPGPPPMSRITWARAVDPDSKRD